MGEPEAKKRPKPAETLAPMAKRKKGHLPPPPEPPRDDGAEATGEPHEPPFPPPPKVPESVMRSRAAASSAKLLPPPPPPQAGVGADGRGDGDGGGDGGGDDLNQGGATSAPDHFFLRCVDSHELASLLSLDCIVIDLPERL